MLKCKKCESESIVKDGKVRGKQRYLCKECGYNFVEGDAQTNEKIQAKKAMCVLQYAQGKASYNMLAKLYHTWPSLVYRWVKEAGMRIPEPQISENIKEIEFDEMRHFIGRKKTNFGSSER